MLKLKSFGGRLEIHSDRYLLELPGTLFTTRRLLRAAHPCPSEEERRRRARRDGPSSTLRRSSSIRAM